MAADFYERLEELCEKKGLRPQSKEIIKLMGVTSPAVTTWKRSGTVPKASVLLKLADYFDVSLEYLLGGDEVGQISETEQVLLNAYRECSTEDQMRIMAFVIGKKEDSQKTGKIGVKKLKRKLKSSTN